MRPPLHLKHCPCDLRSMLVDSIKGMLIWGCLQGDACKEDNLQNEERCIISALAKLRILDLINGRDMKYLIGLHISQHLSYRC